MDLLYVLVGGAAVITGYLIAKIDLNREKRSKEDAKTIQELKATVDEQKAAVEELKNTVKELQEKAPAPAAEPEQPEPEEDPNKIPLETQLADMQSYDPMKAKKKGRSEE